AHVGEAVGSAWAVTAGGGLEPLPAVIRSWLSRALHFDSRNAFASAVEAQAELDEVLSDSGYIAAPAALARFLAELRPIEPETVADEEDSDEAEDPAALPARDLRRVFTPAAQTPQPAAQTPPPAAVLVATVPPKVES